MPGRWQIDTGASGSFAGPEVVKAAVQGPCGFTNVVGRWPPLSRSVLNIGPHSVHQLRRRGAMLVDGPGRDETAGADDERSAALDGKSVRETSRITPTAHHGHDGPAALTAVRSVRPRSSAGQKRAERPPRLGADAMSWQWCAKHWFIGTLHGADTHRPQVGFGSGAAHRAGCLTGPLIGVMLT